MPGASRRQTHAWTYTREVDLAMRLAADVALPGLALGAYETYDGARMSGAGDHAHAADGEITTPAAAVALTETQAQALLAAVYTQYAGALHSYAYRLLGNQEDADDVMQEVFIRVHGRIDQLRDPARLRPWLYRIATNLCMDYLRRRARTRKIFGIAVHIDGGGDEAEETGAQTIAEPGSTLAIDSVAERDHIRLALRRMPPKYATCLVLHSAQGLSYREIAEILGITPGAAAVRLARARVMFGRCYDALRGEDRP